MRRVFQSLSIRGQLLGLCLSMVLLTSGSVILGNGGVTGSPWHFGACLGLAVLLTLAGASWASSRARQCLAELGEAMKQVAGGELGAHLRLPVVSRELADLKTTFDQMVGQLQRARADHERSQRGLAARGKTVDRLLDFSQTIQGAGRSEQVFSTLCHFLQSELSLAGLAILAHEPAMVPATQVKACLPEGFVGSPAQVAELDTALCPCLRQNQPRQFRADGSPVRCMIDQLIVLGALHPAYCIPFNVGRKMQAVVHMLLPPHETWTEERRQLAQTYVNTAQSALISLQLLAEAEQQSLTDALTGLYNRRSLEQLLEREVALAERHQRSLSVVMIDLDFFKQINDTHGHAAGDHLLRAFADCVRITLRKTDLAFRFGGDEFVIALPQTTIAQAQQVVQKLRQAFATVDFSSAIARLDQQPTLSIGVAERTASNNLLTLSALLAAADQALYEAKTSNRNCVRTYHPPTAAA